MSPRDRQTVLRLCAGFFLLYLATAPGGLPRYDAAQMLVTAAAVADHGFTERADFSRYGIGQSLIDLPVVPLYHLAQATAAHAPAAARKELLTLAGLGMASLPALMAALLNALVFGLSRHLGYAPRPSLLLALAGGLGTMVWVYAGLLFADLTIACLWLLTLLALRLALTRQHHGLILLAGMGAGFAVLVKPVAGVALPFFALYLWHGCRGTGWSAYRALVLFSLPLAGALAGAAWFNHFRFGAPWRTGYEGVRAGWFTSSSLLGLYGLLLSSGKGVFFYNPLLLYGVIGAVRFWRAHRREAWLIAGLTAALLAVTTAWFGWHGDWAWGPRLLLPLIPLLTLCAAPVAEQVVARGTMPGGRAGLAGLLLLTVFAQGGGLLFEAGDYIVMTNTLAGQPWYHPQFWPVDDDCELLHFSPRYSPLIGHWWLVARGLLGPDLLPPWPAVTDATLAPQPAWRLWWLELLADRTTGNRPATGRPVWVWLAAGLLFAGAWRCGHRAWQLTAHTGHQQ